MGLLARIFGSPSVEKSTEGAYRDGPWYLPLTGGWLPQDVGQYINWWQNGHNPSSNVGSSAMVEACISAYAQTVAMCPGDHWLRNEKNGRDRVSTSSLSRLLRRPNSYQSASDFLLNLVRNLYSDGNAYALAVRNSRFEISELHLMKSSLCAPRIATTGDIFYDLAGNPIVDQMIQSKLTVPARDVLHVRLHTPNHPLIGVTPLIAAALSMSASDAMMRQQVMFFINQARPSTVLTTDLTLKRDQVNDLRALWNEQSKGLAAGGTPILTSGLKPHNLSSTAKDTQLAEILKLSDQNIALVFRVPLQILGIGGTPFASTESLMQSWLAGGLNFALNHIEVAFDALFNLRGQPDEYTEFNTDVLLRSALKDRIESYAAGTRAGIFSPNEARAQFELEDVKDGDEPRMQQQDVPLSYGAALEPPKPAAAAAPPSDNTPQPKPDSGAAAADNNKGLAYENEQLRQSFRSSHARHSI